MYGDTGTPAANEQNQVLQIERFLRLPALPFKCCCLQYTTVTDTQNEKLLGSVRENLWICVPTYTIYGPDGEEVMDVHQRACCCSCFVDICATDSSCCGLRVPFQLYYPGTDQVRARSRTRPRARASRVSRLDRISSRARIDQGVREIEEERPRPHSRRACAAPPPLRSRRLSLRLRPVPQNFKHSSGAL